MWTIFNRIRCSHCCYRGMLFIINANSRIQLYINVNKFRPQSTSIKNIHSISIRAHLFFVNRRQIPCLTSYNLRTPMLSPRTPLNHGEIVKMSIFLNLFGYMQKGSPITCGCTAGKANCFLISLANLEFRSTVWIRYHISLFCSRVKVLLPREYASIQYSSYLGDYRRTSAPRFAYRLTLPTFVNSSATSVSPKSRA